VKPARKRRLIFLLAILTGFSIAIALMLVALKDNISLFYSPSQVASGEAPVGPLIRVGGLVVAGSVHRDHEGTRVQFDITDKAHSVTVVYDDILPDLFREGQGIVALGHLQANGQFVATEVLAKHDETYMSPEVADAIKKAEAKARGMSVDELEKARKP
jgi:cytochrome c-type biogenesis protein CcmE